MQEARGSAGLRLLALGIVLSTVSRCDPRLDEDPADNGGVRGLSQLFILEEIMYRIYVQQQLHEVPRPCDYFDLIGGTGTGGIIAVMLGRLQMSMGDAIIAYAEVMRRVSASKKSGPWQGTMFRASVLEAAIKDQISNLCGDREALMRPHEDTPACKTFVCPMSIHQISDRPRLLRSYEVPQNSTYNCKIWEAARATTATPTMFKSIGIGPEGLREEFLSNLSGCNNPAAEVIEEARQAFDEEASVACIVSIGAGREVFTLRSSGSFRWMPSKRLAAQLVEVATDCELVSERLGHQLERMKPEVYFRFNIDHGMRGVLPEEGNQIPEMKSQTLAYLLRTSVDENLDEVVNRLWQSASLPMVTLSEIS